MSNLLKNLLIALGLALILFIGYFVFFRSEGGGSAGLIDPATFSADAQLETQRLLSTLNELKEYDVSASLFEDNIFQSLIDFRVDLGSEPVGRQNPFAPLQ